MLIMWLLISILFYNLAVGCQDLVCFTSNSVLEGLIGNYTWNQGI